MDELTRERFWPTSTKTPPPPIALSELDLIAARQQILLDIPETMTAAAAWQQVRIRGAALARSRRLAGAIRTYEVRSSSRETTSAKQRSV